MEVLEKIKGSFFSQGTFGFGVIVVILVILVFGIVKGIIVKRKYSALLNEFNASEKKASNDGEFKGELNFKEGVLSKVEEQFKRSAENGTENINTEVIIQKNIGQSIVNSERTIKLLPAMCIAFGLLGTFLGLTMAIIDTSNVLGPMGSMEEFALAMEGPFASMSSAFWTSIVGVISSVILNGFNASVENKKEGFYDVIEDYLDNVIYGLYANSFNNLFTEFNTTIRTTMTNLAKDMRELFKDGVSELVSKINKNTIDLTSTVAELTNYTKDLDRLTKSLNTSVDNFKEPVDKFKVSIYEFTSIAEDLSANMKDSINKFSSKVDLLESNLSNLYNSVDSNKNELANIGISLKVQSEKLNDTYSRVIDLINSVSNIQTSNNDELKLQVEKLNKGYESFEGGLVQFIKNLELLQTKISDGITNTMDKGMTSLTNKIVEGLDEAMREVAASTEQLNSNTLTIGEVVKASNDLLTSINNSNN